MFRVERMTAVVKQAGGDHRHLYSREDKPEPDAMQRVGQHPVSLVHQLTPRTWKAMFADNPLRLDLHDHDGRRTCAAA